MTSRDDGCQISGPHDDHETTVGRCPGRPAGVDLTESDEPCPSCDRDLAAPGVRGHVCYTYAEHAARILAVAVARAQAAEAVVETVQALRDDWADFDHDAATCPKFDCGDCTMLNAIHDLDLALASASGPTEPTDTLGEK